MSNKYQSRYSDSQVTAAQFITELICEKKALKQKKDLPQQFWKIDEWKAYYRQQILAANALLKMYDEIAIIKALKSERSYGVFSLRAPQLDTIIEVEQRLLIKEAETKIVVAPTTNQPRPQFTEKKNNRINKLDG